MRDVRDETPSRPGRGAAARYIQDIPVARDRTGAEGGFALLTAILVLLGVTVLAAGGYWLSSTDWTVSDNHRSALEAFYAADAGQQHYLGTQGFPQSSATYDLGRDSAEVESRRLLELGDGLALFEVRADGFRADVKAGGSALRRLQTVAVYSPLPLNVPGAFTAPNGLEKNGDDGVITGYDQASPGPCLLGGQGGQDPVAGVAVPPSGYQQNGGESVPEGDPPIDDSQSASQLVNSTGIDWPAMVNEERVEPDYRYPDEAWPDFSGLSADEWPVIHVTSTSAELKPTMTGRGTIILDGDAVMDGGFSWDGIILVGGRLVSNGGQTINGAVFTGLNRQLGMTPPASEMANGEKTFQFHSCNVETARRSMGWLSEKPGAWQELL